MSKLKTGKPPAEVIGDFAEVMKTGQCQDGRGLYLVVVDKPEVENLLNGECYVRGATAHQCGKAILEKLGVRFEKVNKGRFDSRLLAELREWRAAQEEQSV